MKKKFVKDIAVKGKTVFLRNDFNVPQNAKLGITDDTRIREALPTYQHLLKEKCRIVCCSHLGRPKGEVIPDCSLKPVAKRLEELLGQAVHFSGETVGSRVDKAKSALKGGEILMLENLRFHPGETKNDEAFARELARGIDVYVDDAFGACHRAHASIDRITRFVPISAAGFLLKKEIDYLSLATENPPKEYLLILGGVKVSDKIPIIQNLIGKVQTILIGGAMAYTFLKSQGEDVGNSKVEPESLPVCKEIVAQAKNRGVTILLPSDHIAAVTLEPNVTLKITRQGETIPPDMMGLDIGPDTVARYAEEIAKAKLIVWNGPMGVFEEEDFSGGTMEVAKAVASSKATTIVGGGDSVAAVKRAGVADRITHISTGGGASLEFLSGLKLPGIEALSDA